MPDIHVPHLDDEHEAAPRHRLKAVLKLGLEVALITTGVFLGLAGEQWRESVRHHELAHESLVRFRDEFRTNKAQVLRVHDMHKTQEREMEAYLTDNNKALMESLADPRKALPQPIPNNITDSAGFDYSAWETALATQSLAYINPDLVASMSSAYRMQQMYEDSHRAITQASYSAGNPVVYLRGVTGWFGNSVIWEEQLLKWYDDLLPRLDRAIAGL
jgi:hypothetical protein